MAFAAVCLAQAIRGSGLTKAESTEAEQQRWLPVPLAALLCAEAAHRGRGVWLGCQ